MARSAKDLKDGLFETSLDKEIKKLQSKIRSKRRDERSKGTNYVYGKVRTPRGPYVLPKPPKVLPATLSEYINDYIDMYESYDKEKRRPVPDLPILYYDDNGKIKRYTFNRDVLYKTTIYENPFAKGTIIQNKTNAGALAPVSENGKRIGYTIDGEFYSNEEINNIMRGPSNNPELDGMMISTSIMHKFPQINAAVRTIKEFEAYEKALDQYNRGVSPMHMINKKQKAAYDKKLDKYLERQLAKRYNENKRKQQQIDAYYAKLDKFNHSKRQDELNRVFTGRIGPKVYADISPFNPEYGSKKRWTKKQLEAMGVDYGTYKTPKTKTLSTIQGDVQVIDNKMFVPLGFDKEIGYKEASNHTYYDGTSMTDKYEHYFDGKHKLYSWIASGNDSGHIKAIKYNRSAQLMEVTFYNNNVVIYDRVPYAVALELISLGESGYTMMSTANPKDKKPRHVVGIRFWDLVRIRGTKHGSQYPYFSVNGGRTTIDYAWFSKNKDNKLKALRNQIEAYEYSDMFNQLIHGRDELMRSDIKFNEDDPAGSFSKALEYFGISGKSKDKIMKIFENKVHDRLLQYDIADSENTFGPRIRNKPIHISIDDVDNYFDTMYNKDLANKNVKKSELIEAYNMYESGADFMDVANKISKAGGNIKHWTDIINNKR